MNKIKEGDIAIISLNKNEFSYCRILPGIATTIWVYNRTYCKEVEKNEIETIINDEILFYCGVYRDVFTKKKFPIVGNIPFSSIELKRIKPFFSQDLGDFNLCNISWVNGDSKMASPTECIGLEKGSVWEAEGIINRIIDMKSGKKNYTVERNKVILDAKDPRNTKDPRLLRWDFIKEEFYLTD